VESRPELTALTYDGLVAELFPRLTGGIRWGLDRTVRMLASVGDPHRAFRVVHVGGTNGKGSVAAHAESVLRKDGRAVGLYSSPHLCTFRERVRVHGRAITEDALLDAAQSLWPAVQREQPSFFEATTAIAFLALARAGVDIAVVEVGLGGRLDATNVVEPDVVVLTNVSLDHVQLLGPTVRDIAGEKAGIIKPGVTVVTAEATEPALGIFRDAARAMRAQIDVIAPAGITDVRTDLAGTSFTLAASQWGPGLRLRSGLAGAHQATNAGLAARALGQLPDPPSIEALVDGLADVRWPGRLQLEHLHGSVWVFDVAHNVAGVESLVAALASLPLPRPVTAVVGVLGDKDWPGMLGPICVAAQRVVLTSPPTAPEERRWNPLEVLAQVPCAHAIVEPDFLAALQVAHRHASDDGGCVVVTGSFHTVGDALAVLGICPDGRDVHMPLPSFAAGPRTGGSRAR
jgi:dihydrofolate synthase / folylpolyglutamate synthase